MSVLERIRLNDPRRTSVLIGFTHYEDFFGAEFAEALEQNPHIVSFFVLVPRNLQNFQSFLRHLETRNNLLKVQLLMQPRVPLAILTSFLQALQRNTNVRDITISGVHEQVPVGALVSFFNSATHITDLSLSCGFDNSIDGPVLLAASLQSVTNLQSLKLKDCVPSEYLVAIFDNLKRKPSLQTLELSFHSFSYADWDSFKNLMRSTSTVRELVVGSLPTFSKEIFLKTVKSNFSLRVVREACFGSNIFTAEDKHLLFFYTDRNKRMYLWTERPDSVPQHLRPEVLHVAAQAHPWVLFRSLVAIAGELGTTKNTRKRKRPA